MAIDLADYQAEAVAHGYTHDFGFDGRSTPSDIANELRACRPAVRPTLVSGQRCGVSPAPSDWPPNAQ